MDGVIAPWSEYLSRERFLALTVSLFLTVMYALVLWASRGMIEAVIVFPLLALLLTILASFEVALVVLVISLFVDYHIWWYSSSVWFSLPLALSFLLKYRDIAWKEFANPMTLPLVIYGVSILPSFSNAAQPLRSIVVLYNVVAFLIVSYALAAALRDRKALRRLVIVYLVVAALNALHVLTASLMNGKRVFGFAGIMFVDYAGLGITVSAAISVVTRGKVRILSFLVSMLLIAALVMTQTRSIWAATLMALTLLSVYAWMKAPALGLNRGQLFRAILVAAVVISVVSAMALSVNPSIEKRVMDLSSDGQYAVSAEGNVQNSLVSRALIWDTALNAFLAHPYFGIGVYSFPFVSHQYSRLPSILYERFVAGVSPHQSFIAVLCETGLVGGVGFFGFLIFLWITAFRAVKRAGDEQSKKYAFVGAMTIAYCTISMLFTDSWLWGQGIVLLGIVTGMTLANRTINALKAA